MSSFRLGFIAALFIFAAVDATGGELWKEDLKEVHIVGKVLCQDCSLGWNDWNNAAKSIKGSKVAVTCVDTRHRVVYYGSDETDETGNFDIAADLRRNSGELSKNIRPNRCSVRLVTSPDAACNVMTNFGGGRSGVRLVRPSHVYPGRVKYTVGPFFFTSPMCEEPDLNE